MNRAEDGTILRISEKSANLLGMSRQKANGLNFFDIAKPELADALREHDRKLLAQPTVRSSDLRKTVGADGVSDIRMSTENFVFGAADDTAATVYSIGTDVTGVVEAGEMTETALAQFGRLHDLAHIGYWSLDVESRKVHWSEEVYRLHGIPCENDVPTLDEMIGFQSPEDREKLREALHRVIKKGGEFQLRTRIVSQDGETVVVEIVGVSRGDRRGMIDKIVGVLRSVPEMH